MLVHVPSWYSYKRIMYSLNWLSADCFGSIFREPTFNKAVYSYYSNKAKSQILLPELLKTTRCMYFQTFFYAYMTFCIYNFELFLFKTLNHSSSIDFYFYFFFVSWRSSMSPYWANNIYNYTQFYYWWHTICQILY